jgi:hypothetical protein
MSIGFSKLINPTALQSFKKWHPFTFSYFVFDKLAVIEYRSDAQTKLVKKRI